MKTNVRGVLFSVGFLSLVACLGCAEDQVAADVPALLNAGSVTALAAVEPDGKAPPANPPPAAVTATPSAARPATNIAAPGTNLVFGPVEAPTLSPAMTELVRLIQAGVNPDVLTAFITNSATPFYVGSSEILYLRDLGAPSLVLTTLIQHDSSPEIVARKQAAVAVKPLPPGLALNTPATNVFPRRPAALPVQNPPEPMPVNPPVDNGAATFAPPPPVDMVAYEAPLETQPVNYSYFYNSLAPYGAWTDVPGYGSCWQPTCATYNPGWRPYCNDGRWLWSNSGWYWYSDYSWGWAPFHYGRWCQPAGLGWVWQPDTCWGSSWVSWRYSAGYCGWAPLPPSACWTSGVGFYNNGFSVGVGFDFGLAAGAYVFCPTASFCDRRPYNHCVPPQQANAIYKDSTVINNYVIGNNNTIVNHGVGYDKVAKVTRGDIRRVALKDTTLSKDMGTRHERLEPDGNTLLVHRPPAAALATRSTVPASSRPIAGVTGPRKYGESPAGASSLISGSGSASVGAFAKPAPGSTLSSVGAAPLFKPGLAGTTKPAMMSSVPSSQEPRTIKPIIIRRNEAPILAGGPVPEPISATKDSGYAYNSAVNTPAKSAASPGTYTKPTPAAGTSVASAHVEPSSVARSPGSPTGVKPSVSAAKPSSISQSPAGGAPRTMARTEPAGNYTKPVAARAPVTQASAPSYAKPVSPARSYSAPVHSAPASSAAPRVAPASSAPRPSVSVSSGGGSRPAGAPASSGSSRSVSTPSTSTGGKVGR